MKITKELESTAYHEAGHYVFAIYYESQGIIDNVPLSISIIPNNDRLGAVKELSDGISHIHPSDLTDEMIKASVCCFLAGYAVQKILDPGITVKTSGSIDDFEGAKKCMEKFKTEIPLKILLKESIDLATQLWAGVEVCAKELLDAKEIANDLEMGILQVKVERALGIVSEEQFERSLQELESWRDDLKSQ